MTVSELLKRMLGAYPSFDAKAGETWAPVFRARLGRHEGERLAAASLEVLGSFKPTVRQPFPIPADFEAHLPSGKLDLGRDSGPSIRQWLEDRARKGREAYAEWANGQGAKIKTNRPAQVYTACQHMAADLSRTGRRVVLSADQIKLCEERALSQERVRMFGPPPKTAETWLRQIQQVREAWANVGQQAAA